MSGPVEVKICGLSTAPDIDAAARAGARYGGFVFFPPSPRAVDAQQAVPLAAHAPPGLAKVGLFVAPDDAALDAVLSRVPLDMIQIHKVSDPVRLAAIRARAGLPLIAALPVATRADLAAAGALAAVADMLLLDARAAPGATLPGGNGLAFDWQVLEGWRAPGPWMLAGGLTPDNVAEAIARTRARRVDVSSGVESAPGTKDPARIEAFARAAMTPGSRLREQA